MDLVASSASTLSHPPAVGSTMLSRLSQTTPVENEERLEGSELRSASGTQFDLIPAHEMTPRCPRLRSTGGPSYGQLDVAIAGRHETRHLHSDRGVRCTRRDRQFTVLGGHSVHNETP